HPKARRGAQHPRVRQELGRHQPLALMLMALLIPPHQPVEMAQVLPLQEQEGDVTAGMDD
ncbi:hypothetical protein NDU88_010837, partial [Pleurodeles waltl]